MAVQIPVAETQAPGEHGPIGRPSNLLTVMESRAMIELAAFVAASPALRCMGRGDRHPVLVLPGFAATDRSTEPLRWFLRNQGYWTHGWSLGRNLGPTRQVLDGIETRLAYVYGRHRRPVSVIGWSLGGIYGRSLARRYPEMVRDVITLGSPFRMAKTDRSAAEPLWRMIEHTFGKEADEFFQPEHLRDPLAVPATAMYTRGDGIVKWYTCIESAGPRRESIEVRGSHSGLGFNPAALLAIADRLRQPEGTWRPFVPPMPLRRLYPTPVSFRERRVTAA